MTSIFPSELLPPLYSTLLPPPYATTLSRAVSYVVMDPKLLLISSRPTVSPPRPGLYSLPPRLHLFPNAADIWSLYRVI